MGRGRTVPGWLSIPAWATSGPWEARTITPTNLAVGVALSQLLPAQPQHQNISPESAPVRGAPSSPADLSPGWDWGTAPPAHLSSRKRGWCRLTAAASPNQSPFKSFVDAFYTLRVKKIFKSCEPDVPIFPLKMPILLFLTTHFSNFYLVYLEALLKLSNSTAYDINNALRGDTHLW